ncbi:MAG TPA: histidine kinase [Solirubrobacteraceae bacterium]|nr:histidine kinase [Solirubrobacteraceae bacterium]
MLLDEQNAVIDHAGGSPFTPARRFARAGASPAPASPASALCGPASLSLQNRLLRAQLREQNDELRASRARLVAAADAERRRLERDLHDGAQSRFVAIALELRRAHAKAPPGSEVARMLDRAIAELGAGLDELRELARGIHPAVLTERGLDAALDALAARAPLPVEVEGTLGGRVAEAAEIAAYYVVSEALANVAKYAGADHATVRVAHRGDRLVVEVADDGVGGARPEAGSGLRGIADRVGALDGRLGVHSPAGEGTRVRVEIPCPPPTGR